MERPRNQGHETKPRPCQARDIAADVGMNMGVFSPVPDPDPRGVGSSVGRGVQGGGVNFFRIAGALGNPPFPSEHFECTQGPGGTFPFYYSPPMGKMGGNGGGHSVPRAPLAPHRSPLVWVGGPGGWGWAPADPQAPPPPPGDMEGAFRGPILH